VDGRGAIALCLGAALALAGCETTLQGGLDERQADEVMVALDRDGIASVKHAEEGMADETRYEVRVASDDVPRALGVLRQAQLPRHEEPGLAEVFGEGGLVPTATEERARYVAALGGELARSVESIDGVLDARVHVALPESRDFALDGPQPRPRASVMIKHRAGAAPYDPVAVRALVAGAVDGMTPEDVAVVGVPAPRIEPRTVDLVRIGPIAVTRGSAGALKMVLGASLAINLILAGALAFTVLRRRRAAAAPAEPAPPAG
jgi:type III secretion protein J